MKYFEFTRLLQDYEDLTDISDEMKVTITKAKNKLLQYYNKTDASLYTITTNNWERRYIDSAQKLINSEISNNENDGEDDLTSQIYKCKHIAHNSNELNLYLKDPNAQEKTDVLLWWKVNAQAGISSSSQNGKDYLAIPASSVQLKVSFLVVLI
ncbi:13366_t:CDS:2 [Entrophospora sp. SA101]|nr:13366_t:CDS:2 [Entrophospora sp. SA101]